MASIWVKPGKINTDRVKKEKNNFCIRYLYKNYWLIENQKIRDLDYIRRKCLGNLDLYKNNFKLDKMRYNRQSCRNIFRNYFNRQRQRRWQYQPQQQPRPQPQVSPQPPSPVPTIISISSSSSTSFHNPSLLPLYRARDFSYSRENQDLQNQVEDL